MQTRALVLLATALVLTTAALGQNRPAAPDGSALFETQVRPLFLARCVSCHKGTSAAAGLRLDTPDGWKKVVVPGQPEKSRLIQAVRHAAGTPAMPPSGAKLTERELAGLVRWVAAGAPGPAKGNRIAADHWAFQPLRAPRGTIDGFIAVRQKQEGLVFAPEADRRTWLRRVTFDLTGLPPTPQEATAFLADTKPDAYERVVDRLLASPHYGEKWARHWLDLARFAESHGYEQDYDRPNAYTYRDFVIRAYNDDLPFTTFAQWQLAGDELAPENPQALFATGFLGAGTHATQITKSQVEKERYDELDDMLSVTMQSFLGLTVGCARCHDHKYDPIPTRDYYRLLSTFTTTVRSDYAVPTDPTGDQQRLAAWETAHAPLVAARERWEKEQLPARFAAWQATVSVKPIVWLYPTLEKAVSAGGATLTEQSDHSITVTGTNPEHEALTFTFRTTLKRLTALRIEALADPSLVRGGPGRASNGNFALSVLTLQIGEQTLRFASAKADFEQAGLPVAAAIDSDPISAWAVDPQFGKTHAAVFTLAAPVAIPDGAPVTVRLEFNNNTGHGMGRPRIALAEGSDPSLTGLAVADGPDGWRQYYKTIDPEWQALNTAVEAHLAAKPKPTQQLAMICSEGVPAIRTHTQGGDYLEQTHFLKRGDPNQKGEVAQQGFLTCLTHAPASRWQEAAPTGWRTSYRRRALAHWLTDTQSGAGNLLARVYVNRLWQRLFGRGIVATPSDFGAMGERPTHPELLDFLAQELITNGWRTKPLLRQLVLSRTYRQRSGPPTAKDPDNRWLAHFSRRRLEAEHLRDAMLVISGQLDTRLYGPGTLDEAMSRRGIYFFIKRSRLVPFLTAFDGPNSLQSIGARQTTTVAPQALILLNNPNTRRWAAAFATRVTVPYAPAESVRRAYQLALCRPPHDTELKDAVTYLNQGGTLTELCQILFSLNEFVYVE